MTNGTLTGYQINMQSTIVRNLTTMVWKERLYYANKALKTSSYFPTTKLTLTIWMEYSIAICAMAFPQVINI